jgi:hypothetical protein
VAAMIVPCLPVDGRVQTLHCRKLDHVAGERAVDFAISDDVRRGLVEPALLAPESARSTLSCQWSDMRILPENIVTSG